MPDQKSSLVHKVGEAVARNPGEHVLNVLKAGLATTPFCGGIASLMNDYIPSAKVERLTKFAEQLAADLTALQDKVNEERLLTDQYAFLFEQSFRGVAESYQEEKLDAFRAVLINAAIGVDFGEDENEYFLNLISTLSVLHIRILTFMARPLEYLEANGISRERIQGGFSQFFPVAIPGVDVSAIKSAFGDLHQYGLINTDKSIFSTMTSGQGLHLLGDRVSEHGKRFIAFCTAPGAPAGAA